MKEEHFNVTYKSLHSVNMKLIEIYRLFYLVFDLYEERRSAFFQEESLLILRLLQLKSREI